MHGPISCRFVSSRCAFTSISNVQVSTIPDTDFKSTSDSNNGPRQEELPSKEVIHRIVKLTHESYRSNYLPDEQQTSKQDRLENSSKTPPGPANCVEIPIHPP